MTILFLTYQGGIAGSTNSIAYLSEALAKKGHEVYVGCSRNRLLWQKLQNSKVNLWEIEFKNKIDIGAAKKIANFARKNSIEIINAQSSYDRYAASIAKKFFGINSKVIHTRRQVALSAGGFIQKIIYSKWTDGIIAVSRGVKESLIKIGIPENKIEVIYNGTPVEKYQNINLELTNAIKNKLKIDENCFVIGCVSRRKKQIQLIQAASKLNVSQKIKLVFVGIEGFENLNREVKNLPSNIELCFEGLKTNEETLAYYKIFDLFVLPSTTEGFSQSLLESAYMEVPIIATDASGNNEFITDGVDGFLFQDGNIEELAKKLLILYQNKNLRNEFSKNLKQKVERYFLMENVAINYENYFNKILNKQ